MLEGYARLLLAQFSFGKPFAQTELASVSYGSARVILHAAQWMIQHYHEPVVIRELADRFCCGTERFARLFRRHMGMSPKEFLIRLRMDKARNLMYSNLAVKHVAQQVGYDDALYFSRLFKKTYDLSPDEFRKRIPLRQGAASWRKDGSFGLAKPEPDRVLAFETASRIGEGSGDSGSL
jgi:AraC-like DNA-binding protein